MSSQSPTLFLTPAPANQRSRASVTAALILVFALFSQELAVNQQVPAVHLDGWEAELPLQRALTKLGNLVEKTIAIRFQRDALTAKTARQQHERSAESMVRVDALGPIENDVLTLDPAHKNIRASLHKLNADTEWLASDSETIAFNGLKARTAIKAIALIEAAKRDGIELKVIAGYSGDRGPDILGRKSAKDLLSTHSTGFAFDVVVVRDGAAYAGPSETLNRVGAIGQTLGLIWGGEFSRHQAWSHFELPIARRELGRRPEVDSFAREGGARDARPTDE